MSSCRDFWVEVFKYLSPEDQNNLGHTCRFFWNLAAQHEYVSSVLSICRPVFQTDHMQLSKRVVLVDLHKTKNFINHWVDHPSVNTLCLKIFVYKANDMKHPVEFLPILKHFPLVENLVLYFGTKMQSVVFNHSEIFSSMKKILDKVLDIPDSFPSLKSISIHACRQYDIESVVLQFFEKLAVFHPLLYVSFSDQSTIHKPEFQVTNFPIYRFFTEIIHSKHNHRSVISTEIVSDVAISYAMGVHPATKQPLNYPFNFFQILFEASDLFHNSQVSTILERMQPHIVKPFPRGKLLSDFLSNANHAFSYDIVECLLSKYKEDLSYQKNGKNCIDLAFEFALHRWVKQMGDLKKDEHMVEQIGFMETFLNEVRWELLYGLLLNPLMQIFNEKYAQSCNLDLAKAQANPFCVIADFFIRFSSTINDFQMMIVKFPLFTTFIEDLCSCAKTHGFTLYQIHPTTKTCAAEIINNYLSTSIPKNIVILSLLAMILEKYA